MLDLLRQGFVQNAFLAGTIIAVISGIVGYFVILRGQAFATETLSHVGFAGAAGAALIGINSLIGMIFLTVLTAIGMGTLGQRVKGRDIEVGMVLSFMLGLGVLFLSLYTQNATRAVNLLFGSILSVTREDVMLTLGSSVVVLIVLIILFRPLLFASLDPVAAEARGVPVQTLSILFLFVLALTVSQAVEVVGALLVFALLIVPAASAERFAIKPFSVLILSVVISLFSTWSGLLLSLVGHQPASFYIVAFTSLFYIISRLAPRFRIPGRYRELPHPSREV
ncbi:MAG: metal ABC transporter permease [Chloroflexi bacterium]|nr:metal ABC transporter permease [Chloroflexota bacterium]